MVTKNSGLHTGQADDRYTVGFASVVFRFVFAVVNLCAILHRSFSGAALALPIVGVIGCLAADVRLVVDLHRDEQTNIGLIAGITAAVLIIRGVHLWTPSRPVGRD